MPRYVEVENLEVSDYVTVWDCNCSEFGKQLVMAIDDLQYLPAADVQEVKHGHWIRCNDQGGVRCSKCRHATNERILRWYRDNENNICYQSAHPFYCSRCGAKMDLEEESLGEENN